MSPNKFTNEMPQNPIAEDEDIKSIKSDLKSIGKSLSSIFESLKKKITFQEYLEGTGEYIDERIIEADFGPYELKGYYSTGLPMMAYWSFPELFKAPSGVETIREMRERTSSFLRELEQKNYENVLVVCHGGIIRPIRGYLEDKKNGIIWRPRPKNCEIFVYESVGGKHRLVEDIK